MNTAAVIPPIHHVLTSGSAHARGLRVGELTRHKVEHSLDTYERLFALCDIPWVKAVQKGLNYLDAVTNLSSRYVEELNGLAQGAAVDFDSLLALNCRTEILPSDFLSKLLTTGDINSVNPQPTTDRTASINECTSFAISGTAENYWLAQNWDWCGLQREALCVVESHCADQARHITVTEAGMLAKIGINAHGLAITLNILRSDKDGVDDGVPVHFLLRTLLDCESVAHAKEVVSALTFSSSSNVMVLDAQGHMASFELSPYGVNILESDEGRLCHTNHFLNEVLEAHDIGRLGNTSTLTRLHRAQNQVNPNMTRSDIIKLLCDQNDGLDSVCRFADPKLPDIAQIETVTAVVMNTAQKTLCVSGAQPSVSEFETYSV